jgi:hypothetical protein
MDIAKLPITITNVWTGERGNSAELKIGDTPAKISEPKTSTTSLGIVYLETVDFEKPDWDSVLKYEHPSGRIFEGYSDDQRLLTITQKILDGKLTERDIGTIYPPIQ